MKDIRKLNLWPFLKENGFRIKKYKANKRTFAVGAVLPLKTAFKLKDVDVDYTFVEIEPVPSNNRYKLTYDDPLGNSVTNYLNSYEITKKIKEIIKNLKK